MKRIFINCKLVDMHADVTDSAGYQVKENSMIEVVNGVVHAVGTDLKISDHDVVDLNHHLVTPGFIDCHTHLVFAGNRANEFEQRLNGVPYQTIAQQGGGILSTVNATRHADESTLIDLAIPRAKALMRDGVTTIEIKSGYGLTLEDELKMLRAAKGLERTLPINVKTTFLGAHAVPPEFKHRADDYIAYVCDEMIPAVASEKLADAVDIFCESIAFSLPQTQRVFECALQHGLNIKGHTEQLCHMGGSELAARMGALSVDHIEYIDLDGVKALAKHGTVATLLPGAFYFLRETQAPPISLLREHGVRMAVSTDFNPGTSPFASLTMMMNMASTLFSLTPKENLYGVTKHAAMALGLQQKGQIAAGFDADFSVWDVDSPAALSYQLGLSPLVTRILNGNVIEGGLPHAN
ncbi:imidazolonepropionase [Enterovibrio norvegicus]|uniref:imidazolonepropionase n=1 Tax=Enterovibrio norvegicus TaxID=188144 RepID=UPI000C852B50|nr:imidazolonepropionase [Enterovibrio norvegicus]PMI40814.1 imidazolonepropionase [Enterovibrio norvegicus]PMN56298.1 imidazolonepropionase [Enterovibrio norvegicus]